MPVTFHPWASLEANPIREYSGTYITELEDITGATKRNGYRETSAQPARLLQASLNKTDLLTSVIATDNEFVHSVRMAYAGHHHLTIRPEDVWCAILTQFSSYVNAHPEELRAHFVAHEGKKDLRIDYNCSDRQNFDYSDFGSRISKQLEASVVDPTLCDWIMPDFTTTTADDKIVACILMMGTFQSYFSYGMGIICGIPSVTLLGEKSDYENILSRLGKFKQYGKEPTQFADLLSTVLRRFVCSFDEPDSVDNIHFWRQIMAIDDSLCGVLRYSGWISAFCFWSEHSTSLYRPDEKQIDGTNFFTIDSEDIAPGWLKVPITIDDGGKDAVMVAGSLGIECSSSGNTTNKEGEVALDRVQPLTGWLIHEKPEETTGNYVYG